MVIHTAACRDTVTDMELIATDCTLMRLVHIWHLNVMIHAKSVLH